MSDILTDVFGRPALECPECGGAYLHQQRVEVFARRHEDTGDGIHTVVEYGAGAGGPGRDTRVSVDGQLDETPSARRDGIKITFECELCEPEARYHTLRIVQHEGNEFVSWEEPDE